MGKRGDCHGLQVTLAMTKGGDRNICDPHRVLIQGLFRLFGRRQENRPLVLLVPFSLVYLFFKLIRHNIRNRI